MLKDERWRIIKKKLKAMQVENLIITTAKVLSLLTAVILIIKTIVFFRFEKDRDPVAFFYFPKPAIKMTNIRHLRVWRKRQNSLSKVFLVLLVLLGTMAMFNLLIFS
jgi:hypothetical protein